MKYLHTIHYTASPSAFAEIWRMAHQGWRTRAYIVKWTRCSWYQIEVAVYRKSKP